MPFWDFLSDESYIDVTYGKLNKKFSANHVTQNSNTDGGHNSGNCVTVL